MPLNLNQHKHQQNAFTLLEVAIAIMIVGLLMGTFMSYYNTDRSARADMYTKQRMDRVMNVIANFVIMNNRMPCPADPGQPENQRGNEKGGCSGNVEKGILPFRTLGISDNDAKDGYGHYMTYVMAGGLSTSSGTGATDSNSKFCTSSPPALLQIRNGAATVSSDVAVALISHGPGGAGGYNIFSNSPSNPIEGFMGTNEANNAVNQTSSNIWIGPYNNVSGTSYFSHRVIYETRGALISRLRFTGCPLSIL